MSIATERSESLGDVTSHPARWHAWAGAIAWIAIALVLYPPSSTRPFDIVDFPQFLPLLRQHESFRDQFRAIAELYASEGRMSLLAYAFLVVKWQAFGDHVIGWQLVRFSQMVAIAVLLFALLRAWGASRAGAYCATALVLCSPSTAIAWIRLNMSEPLGFALLLAMLLLASRERHRLGRGGSLLVLGLLAAALLLMKEMLVVTFVPVVWAYASFDQDGRARRPTLDRRVRDAVVVLSVVALAVLIPVAYVALTAPAQAYAKQFGATSIWSGNLLFTYAGIMLPFPLLLTEASWLVVAGFITYLLLILVGSRMFIRESPRQPHAGHVVSFGFLFPLICVLAYAPWPDFKLLYGIPFLLGPAVLIAAGVTGAQRVLGARRGGGSLVLVVALAVVLAPMLASALAYSRRIDLVLRLSRQIVESASRLPLDAPLAVATCEYSSIDWRDIGSMLAGYGRAVGLQVPAMIDVSCREARLRQGAQDSARSLLIIAPRILDPAPTSIALIESNWSLDYPALRVRRDTVSAVLLPAVQ